MPAIARTVMHRLRGDKDVADQGRRVEATRMEYFCEGCGKDAAYGKRSPDGYTHLYYCGWVDGDAVCLVTGPAPAAPASPAPKTQLP